MAESSMLSRRPALERERALHRARPYATLLATALLLAGCGAVVQVENREAAQEVARLARPPGSVYTGWRVYQDRCAFCHGPDATGTTRGTDLLPKVRALGLRQFAGIILKRYEWNIAPAPPGSEGAALDALVEDVMQRRGPLLAMPEWQDEPRVNAHIADLYAYLAARAEGTQGPNRPARP